MFAPDQASRPAVLWQRAQASLTPGGAADSQAAKARADAAAWGELLHAPKKGGVLVAVRVGTCEGLGVAEGWRGTVTDAVALEVTRGERSAGLQPASSSTVRTVSNRA